MSRLRLAAGLAALIAAALLALACQGGEEAPPASPTPLATGQVTIEYFGHSMFKITSPGGTVILTDPNEGIGYRLPTGRIDVVTASHLHFDHLPKAQVAPMARFIGGLSARDRCTSIDETIGDMGIRTVCTFHDDKQGAERGLNAMFIFDIGGLRILHAGDLGHILTDEQMQAVGEVDVLLVPVGGYFTIGPEEADRLIAELDARTPTSSLIAIPMHYRTDALRDFPDADQLATVDDFVDGKAYAQRQNGTTVAIDLMSLPFFPHPVIIVLDHQPK